MQNPNTSHAPCFRKDCVRCCARATEQIYISIVEQKKREGEALPISVNNDISRAEMLPGHKLVDLSLSADRRFQNLPTN